MAKAKSTTATSVKAPTDEILTGLRNFGWGSGFRSPFANAENKALEDLLEKKQKSNLILRAELEDTLVHTKDLEKHLLESGQDIQFTESLMNSKRQECNNEQSLVRLAERMLCHTENEIKRQRRDLMGYRERNEHQSTMARRRKQVVDELTETVKLDMKLLKVYEAKKVEYEEEMKNVHIYDKIDKSHIHELEAKQVDLGARNKQLRLDLDQCAMNSNKYQEQYTRLCIEFRKVYKQKKEMTLLWAKSLMAMKGRDSEMQQIADEFYEVRAQIRQVKGIFDARVALLNQKQDDLKDSDYTINALDRRLKDLREKLDTSRKLLVTYKDDYSQLNIFIQNTTVSIEALRKNKREMEAQVAAVVDRMRVVEGLVHILREKLEEVLSVGSNKDSLLDELDALIEYEEKLRCQKEREVDKIRMFAFTKSNEKKNILRDHQLRETRMLKCKSSLSIMQQKEFDIMEQLARKQSKIYRMDLDVSQLEMRISRLMNHNIDPRFFVLQERLVKLRDRDEQILAEHREIEKETERVTDLTHAFDRDIDTCLREKKVLEAALFDITLHCERIEKSLADALTSLRYLRIGHSLEVVAKSRVQKNLTRYKDIMFSLTQHRATVEAAVKERKSEIEFMKVLLVKQHRELTKQIGTLSTQQVDLTKYTSKLKIRYDITTSLMAPSSESDGREFSFSAQIYKQVRERENLNTQRDSWAFRIEEATKELEGLKNVLQVTNAANVAFRQSLMPVTDKNNVADHVRENEKKAMVIRNRCKAGRARLRRESDALLKTLGVYQQEVRNHTWIADEKEREASAGTVELQRQADKIRRWETCICRQTKIMLKTFRDPDFKDDLKKELKRRMITEKFKIAILKLRALIHNRPAVSIFIDSYAANRDELLDVVSEVNLSQQTINRRSANSAATHSKLTMSDYGSFGAPSRTRIKMRSELQLEKLKGGAISTNAIAAEFGIPAETELESPPSGLVVTKSRTSFQSDTHPGRTEILRKSVEFHLPPSEQDTGKKSGSGSPPGPKRVSGGSQPRKSLIKPK